eukprot:GFUD01078693.1.p1 GENE.GFUD01078693.1~~GFUD01078693.1.p1  ORF type:complete len:117 (+),score=24.88 GFUD01078693.1:124-474(+)
MDTGFLNSLVADYLTSVSSKLAGKFMKETKSSPLPADSPKIGDMVKHFSETTPKVAKRKLAMTNGDDSAAKKAKKVRIYKSRGTTKKYPACIVRPRGGWDSLEINIFKLEKYSIYH